MAANNLRDIFSAGLTLFDMATSDFLEIISDYNEYIHDVYFSPPYGKKFHSNSKIGDILTPNQKTENIIINILKEIQKKDIKITLCLNTYETTAEEKIQAARRIQEKLNIQAITTLARDIEKLSNSFPEMKFICSFNGYILPGNKNSVQELSENIDSVVIGGEGLRKNKLWKSINATEIDVIYLLNEGTPLRFRPRPDLNQDFDREALFRDNLDRGLDIERLYAEQSIFPRELHNHLVPSPHLDRFKISSRPVESTALAWGLNVLRNLPRHKRLSGRHLLRNCLKSYAENIDKKLFQQSPANLYLWARDSNFYQPVEDFDYDPLNFDFDKILSFKEKLWKNTLKNSCDLFQ